MCVRVASSVRPIYFVNLLLFANLSSLCIEPGSMGCRWCPCYSIECAGSFRGTGRFSVWSGIRFYYLKFCLWFVWNYNICHKIYGYFSSFSHIKTLVPRTTTLKDNTDRNEWMNRTELNWIVWYSTVWCDAMRCDTVLPFLARLLWFIEKKYLNGFGLDFGFFCPPTKKEKCIKLMSVVYGCCSAARAVYAAGIMNGYVNANSFNGGYIALHS